MPEDQLELFIDHVIAVTTGRTVYAVRCHAGTLRLGDELNVATDPDGTRHTVSARCSEIELRPGLRLDELETGYSGAVTLDGVDLNQIGDCWTMRIEG